MTKMMSSTTQMKESQKKLKQQADVSVLVKTSNVSPLVPAPAAETKSKDCSSQRAITF